MYLILKRNLRRSANLKVGMFRTPMKLLEPLESLRPFMFLLYLFATLLAQNCCYGREGIVAGDSSWHWSGLIAYRTGSGEHTELHLLEVGEGKTDRLFTTRVGASIHPPICLSNYVIAVSADGTIRKFDIHGTLAFREKSIVLDGAALFSGRINANHIFVSLAKWDPIQKRLADELHVIDVSGSKPVSVSKFEIIRPLRIIHTSTEIVVIGEEKTQRLKIPDEIDDVPALEKKPDSR